jgi:hypothetical protein
MEAHKGHGDSHSRPNWCPGSFTTRDLTGYKLARATGLEMVRRKPSIICYFRESNPVIQLIASQLISWCDRNPLHEIKKCVGKKLSESHTKHLIWPIFEFWTSERRTMSANCYIEMFGRISFQWFLQSHSIGLLCIPYIEQDSDIKIQRRTKVSLFQWWG